MTGEELVAQAELWKQELQDEVISYYRSGDVDRGDLAFDRWKKRVLDFLKENTVEEATRFQSITQHIGYVINFNEHPFDTFMKDDGRRCIAFLDELKDAALKGRITFTESILTDVDELKHANLTSLVGWENQISPEQLTKLRIGIVKYFNLNELANLCFDLGINYENLPGHTLDEKARELILYCQRRNRLPDLIRRCDELRPQVNWVASDELVFTTVLQTCALQVDAEISSTVGKKFIPKLYVDRTAQKKLDQIIFPERYPKASDSRAEERHFNDGRMYVLTASAGAGKTNLLCYLAKHYSRTNPTLFLTGRSGITERTSVTELVEAKFNRFLKSPIAGKIQVDQLVSTAGKSNARLLLFLDAINEHHDLDLLNSAIADFLIEIEGKPITLVVSCRDVYWPFFETL